MPADRQASRASAVTVGDHDGMTEFGRLGIASGREFVIVPSKNGRCAGRE